MKKCFIDSNVLIYFKDSLSIYHQAAVKKVSKLVTSNTQLFISPLILDEFLYVFGDALIKKKIQAPFDELKRALKEILQIPLISLVNPPPESSKQLAVIDYMREFGLKPRGAYHLLTIISNNIDSFATFDADFSKVFAAKILTKI